MKHEPPPEPLRDFSRSLPMALLRAREAVMARFRPTLQRHDLTEQQWRVLRALTAERAPMRLGAISTATCVSLPSLSRIAKALEARGLVGRKADAGDSRAAQISLTTAGRRLLARIAPLSEASYREIADLIGADELEGLYALLERARQRLAPDDGGLTTAERGETCGRGAKLVYAAMALRGLRSKRRTRLMPVRGRQ